MANDKELCQYLVEQDDDRMDTECELPDNGDGNSTSVAMDVSETMEFSDDSDGFSIALQQLKALANQNNFSIHDVPYDGDCMFSAISYQLEDSGVCSGDSSVLRQKIADFLEANASLYRDFLTDSNFEAMSNPDKFPFGNGTFSSERPKKLLEFLCFVVKFKEVFQSEVVRCGWQIC